MYESCRNFFKCEIFNYFQFTNLQSMMLQIVLCRMLLFLLLGVVNHLKFHILFTVLSLKQQMEIQFHLKKKKKKKNVFKIFFSIPCFS